MITPELMAQLGLTDAADDTAVVMAIKKTAEQAAKVPQLQSSLDLLKTENTTLKTANEAYELATAAAKESEVDALLNKAVADTLISKELSDRFRADYKGNPEGLEAVIGGLKPYQSVTDRLKGDGDASKFEGKTYDQLFESGELEQVRNQHPEMYKSVFRARFGKDPK